jgi:hypothetical protein
MGSSESAVQAPYRYQSCSLIIPPWTQAYGDPWQCQSLHSFAPNAAPLAQAFRPGHCTVVLGTHIHVSNALNRVRRMDLDLTAWSCVV